MMLRVTDSTGMQSVATAKLKIYDTEDPITPVITMTPDSPVTAGTSVSFSATASTSVHQIVSYLWNFGDVSLGSEAQENHFYTQIGTYTVGLTLTDIESNSNTVEKIVVVTSPNAPVADAGDDYAIDEGDTLHLDAGASTELDAAYGDEIQKYEWDINGDGAYDVLTDQAKIDVSYPNVLSHLGGSVQYANAITGLPAYSMTLRVTDKSGKTSTDTTKLAVYTNVSGVDALAPNFTYTPEYPVAGEKAYFDASTSRSINPAQTITTYQWDLDGDGAYDDATGQTTEYTFTSTGNKTVALRITDNLSNMKIYSELIAVTTGNQDHQDVFADISALEIAD